MRRLFYGQGIPTLREIHEFTGAPWGPHAPTFKFEAAESVDAKFAKSLDRLQPLENYFTVRWAEFPDENSLKRTPRLESHLVDLSSLRDVLPAETVFVTRAERSKQLEKRAKITPGV